MTSASSRYRIKRAYETPERSDGQRVLVDRLWPRGLSKEKAELAEWDKEIAPTPELRQWFDHDPARFAEFSRRYREELDHNRDAVARLRTLARKGPVTLVYAAHDEEHNHARVLAAYLAGHEDR